MVESVPSERGRALGAAATLAAVAFGASAHAGEYFIDAPDVVVLAEPSLAPAMHAVGRGFHARTRAPARVFAAPGFVLGAQIAHHARTEVLVVARETMDAAGQANLVRPGTRIDGLETPFVIAAASGLEGTAPVTPALLTRLLGSGRFACLDPTAAAAIDSAAVLARTGLADALAGKTIGGALNGDIVYYLRNGQARLGLLFLADVRAAGLAVAAPLPPTPENTARFAAALTRNRLSRYAQPFLDYLRSAEGRATLAQAGVTLA
jgi:ABC-type molybdate transport system substrate-binding protein